MRNLHIISINHQTFTSQERIALNLTTGQWDELFAYMKYVLGVEGYVHLSTCNRIEIYYEASTDYKSEIIDKWVSLLGDYKINKTRFATYSGSVVCMRYLLELSVGLHSAVIGDDQILAQLKKQFISASENGNLSTLLERTFQTLMRSHKQICKQTDYRKQTVSLAYHSLKSISKIISSKEIKNKKLLIIGAGDMAAQVVKYIDKFTFGSVTITNRTLNKAEILVKGKGINTVSYCGLDTTPYNIIISCTDQGFEMIGDINKLDYYIDLSISSSMLSNIPIPHICLQELQIFIKTENVKRFSSIGLVKEIIKEHVTSFDVWVDEWKLRSTLAENCIIR